MTAAGIRTTPLARVYLLAGLAAIGLYVVLPWNGRAQSILYDLIGATSAVAVVIGVRAHRPRVAAAWYLFAAGLLAFSVGDVIFNFYAWFWHRDPPVPSVADVFYLAGYPFLTVGVVLLALRVRAEERRAGLIDAALLAVAFGICQWIFVMHPLIAGPGNWRDNLVALSYPAMDIVLLAGLAFLALTPAWRTVSYRYLTASIILLVVADEIYALAPDRFAGASFLDTAWLLSYVFWGVAALSPSMGDLSAPRTPRGPKLGSVRLAILAAAIVTAPLALVIERVSGRNIDVVPIAIGSVVLSSLVLLRLAGFVRTLEGLRRTERAARADALAAQRQLALQNEQLREADRLKDEFVALISHDLRTPLTSIIGYLELMLDDGNLTEDQRGYVEVVDRNADRLLQLVNNLLFVARLEAGQLDLRRGPLDLAAVVRQSVVEAMPRAEASGIELTCDVNGEVPVQADKGRMFQVLDNLVSNAIKFTPPGGGVHVSVSPVNGVARLDIEDTGIGIAPADQQHLFERFFRASETTERQIPGTGLGLYITRAIVEAHGGSIAVDSTPGEGTSFSVELPAVSSV